MPSRCFLIMMLKLFKVIIKNHISINKEAPKEEEARFQRVQSMLNGPSKVGAPKYHSSHSPIIAT